MQVTYVCPYWGQEGTKASLFLARVLEEGYNGVEINLPEAQIFIDDFQSSLDNIRKVKSEFVFIAQHVPEPAPETVAEHIARVRQRLEKLVALNPDFINVHTGKDYYTFEDNCRVIDAVETIAAKAGIPVLHETHRSRFTFHAASLLRYFDKFPGLKLTGDFSHWCVVSESMLADQQHIVAQLTPHMHHIHARVGHEQGPQVNDPFAPEWKEHVSMFIHWWNQVLDARVKAGDSRMTITPEFGPVPYMPTLPYSQRPVSDQWRVNAQVKEMLKRKLSVNAMLAER